ncbi:hypothetical protein ACEQUB_p00705 (plasmid) [Ralstonia syzygii]|uniref:Acetyltransferase n=1 Tax=Ralstonia syzygii R24 TaxID=907261 RepID=G3A8K2_9RALS|nr:hypothetical protein RALSY_mp10091 [Ralstonia syzygii R24]
MVRIRSFHPGDEPALHAIFYSAVHQLAATHYTAAQSAAWAPADRGTTTQPNGPSAFAAFNLLSRKSTAGRSAMPICSHPATSTNFSSVAPTRGKGWGRP